MNSHSYSLKLIHLRRRFSRPVLIIGLVIKSIIPDLIALFYSSSPVNAVQAIIGGTT